MTVDSPLTAAARRPRGKPRGFSLMLLACARKSLSLGKPGEDTALRDLMKEISGDQTHLSQSQNWPSDWREHLGRFPDRGGVPGQHGRIPNVNADNLDGVNFRGLLINPEVDLPPDPAFGPTC